MELLADAELQQRMGQAGRKQVEQRFTVDRCVKKVEQIIALADSQVYL
jgi:glycosyltransferase involved in cell wall biosynthesis